MQVTEHGRQVFASFDHAPLLMDGRRKNAAGEDCAEQFNAAELRRLSARTGQPILSIGAHHARGGEAANMKLEVLQAMDAEDFNGLKGQRPGASCGELVDGSGAHERSAGLVPWLHLARGG